MAPSTPPDPPPLPLPPRRLAVVEFPGYVRDAAAAVAALGGDEALAAAASAAGGSKYLAARLRPGDPLAHPLISARKAARGVVLRVATPHGRAHAAPTVTVAGVVTRTFAFPGMADAQYGGAGGGGAPRPVPPPDAALPDETLLAVPPAFFRGDLPPSDGGALPRWTAGGGAGAGRSTSTPSLPAIPFHAAHVPPAHDGTSAAAAAVLAAMGDTPVWAPASLAVDTPATLTAGLPRAAYTFARGAWAGLAIRRGYDPRCDPAAAAWQALRLGDGTLTTAADLAPHLPVVAAALAAPRAAAADPVAGWVPADAWRAAVDAAALSMLNRESKGE